MTEARKAPAEGERPAEAVMRAIPGWPGKVAFGLMALGLGAAAGCMSFCHPVSPPPAYETEACHAVPPCCRSHVHILLVNGLDPFQCANLGGVRHYIEALGFTKVYSGELYHVLWFKHKIRCIRREDPQARF